MANFRIPGPICTYRTPVDIHDGTNTLSCSAPPGILNRIPTSWDGNPTIIFTSPVAGDQSLVISAATLKMPPVRVEICIAGIFPDPSDRIEYFWKAQVVFNSSVCPHGTGKSGSTHSTHTEMLSGSSRGGSFILNFNEVSGGELVLQVDATVGGRHIYGKLSGIRIGGENPSPDQIRPRLSRPILGHIIRQESSLQQFIPAPNADGCMYPQFSQDNLLGVGLGQITKPASKDIELWNWQENIKAIERKFKDALGAASRYPQHCRDSANFKRLCKELNEKRILKKLGSISVIVPSFSDDQLERNAVRCYNGAGGTDNLGQGFLHEYQIALDDAGGLLVDVPPKSTEARTSWEVVPESDRITAGDRGYVRNVYAQPPL